MGRPERPIDPDGGPIADFACELRKLREKAGRPSYRELARRASFSVTGRCTRSTCAAAPSPITPPLSASS